MGALTTLPIPAYTSPFLQSPRDIENEAQNAAIPFIPGGGLTRRILSSLPVGWSVPTGSLIQFVMEGDNRADARLFAAITLRVLGQEVTEWKHPRSWKEGLFGTPQDQTLYG